MSSRSLLLSLVDSPLARGIFARNGTKHSLVSRFVAGDQLSDALQVVKQLDDDGIHSTLDYLGEDIISDKEVEEAVQHYLDLIKALSTFYRDAYVSIKLTAIGLLISPELAKANLIRILEEARDRGDIFVRVDMEGSRHTQITLEMVREMHETFPSIGTVIQSYLRRSDKDIEELNAQKISVRLVKGAYAEPPMVAYSQKSDVDRQFRKQMLNLLDNGTKPAIATHDEQLVKDGKLYAKRNSIPQTRFDFEMLLGVRRDLQAELQKEGYQVRIYIPYGEQWYAYFTRRLAERPANLMFFLGNVAKG